MRPSQNLPLSPRIYQPFQQLYFYATLPESTPPSENTPPPFLTAMCLPLPQEYIPPPFLQLYCDNPRIYP